MSEPVSRRAQSALICLFLLSEALYLPVQPRDGWLLLLAAGTLALLLFVLLHRLLGTFDFSALSGLRGGVIGCIIALLALWTAWSDLSRLSLFFSKTAFPSLPRIVAAALIVLVALVLARNGRTALLIWSFPTCIVLAIPLLSSMLLTVPDWQPAQLLPFPQRTPWEFALAVLTCFCNVYLPLIFPVLLLSGRRPYSPVAGILCGGTLLSLTAGRNLMLLGAFTATKVAYPTFAAAGLVAVGDFFQRAESLIAGCLTVCVLARLAVLLLVTAYGLCPLYLRGRRRKPTASSASPETASTKSRA